MLAIEGALQVIPSAIACDVGQLRTEDRTEAAIVQSFQTLSGVIQVIIPIKEVDKVIEGLEKAKEQSDGVSTDLYIPPSAAVGIKQAENFSKELDEITTPNE